MNPMVEFPPTTGGFAPFVTVHTTDLSCVPVIVNVRRNFSPVSMAAEAGVSCTVTPPATCVDSIPKAVDWIQLLAITTKRLGEGMVGGAV
jgi:hypothetical protein